MIKKLKWLAVIAVIAGITAFGYILFVKTHNTSPQTQQQAINDGLEYLQGPDIPKNCEKVMTPAVHQKTGAKYTFGSSCIPPGWSAE